MTAPWRRLQALDRIVVSGTDRSDVLIGREVVDQGAGEPDQGDEVPGG